ncbi:MAG: hypothetical protein U0S36_05750 [Candidatus Nanopelagicales bacterium]
MGALRVVVPDVDEALTAYAAAGYEVAQRWGPPFAILASADGPEVWLSGPGTSAARSLEGLSAEDAACASVRQVLEVDDVAAAVAGLVAAGWEPAGEELAGPGGSQQLLRRGPVFLEVCAGG